jgi:hypothetical protein
MTTIPFVGFPKLPRLSREIIITEKIDGTNAQVFITDDLQIRAGSRSRWITPQGDNFGFARWVQEHSSELEQLGPGQHFGEWWGSGIQRGYGLTNADKRFSLFNATRWADPLTRPACCGVVPVLYQGEFDTNNISNVLWKLREFGSVAAPGYMNPEGIVIFHTAAGLCFKKTIKDDEVPKALAQLKAA